MNDLFSEIKNALEMVEVVSFYDGPPNRSGFINCPFHKDKTPSCKIYQRRFRCFGCGAAGDQVDFVARLLGLSSLDAAKRLNEDFRLGLDLNAPPDPDRVRAREAKRLFDEWRHKILNQLDAAIRTAILADYGKLTDAEVLALVYREPMEAWADVLMHGKLSEQMAIFRDRREVERLCKTITCSMPPKSKTA